MIAVPLDRNEKARLLHRARALMRATEKGRAYGQVTAKAYAVFCALLMSFHNCGTGRCFPSYDRLQEAAGCCRQTVAASLAALEAAGLLGVCNRLVRVRWKDALAMATRTRVMRTSNCYAFPTEARPSAAEPSKSSFPTGTGNQVFNSDLFAALDRLKRGIQRGQAQDPDRRRAVT
jgi:Helix-turn-helix domain